MESEDVESDEAAAPGSADGAPRDADSNLEMSLATLETSLPEEVKQSTVYVLDAHALIFQVFHALPEEFTSPAGEAVGAVFGFVRDILYLLEEKQPGYLLCAFDRSGPTFRHALYEKYKADRVEMPDELRPQIPKIRRVLDALGVPILEYDAMEADDILATVARICDENRVPCFLVTSDKDCRQLISDFVRLYNVRKDQIYDAASLAADWGIRPDQAVDFQALVGDPTDSVPGVPLIGPKIAGELLNTYDTLDEVLAHAEEVKGPKRRQNLMEARETAQLSRDLVRLDQHVPIQIDWSAAKAGQIDAARAADLFAEFGFRTFGEKMQKLKGAPPAAAWETNYEIIDTPEKLAALVDTLAGQPQIAVDTETTHVWPRWAELVGLSFAWREGEACYVPVCAPAGDACLDREATLAALRPVLENPEIEKVGQNLKYDALVLRRSGVALAGASFDTMIAGYLLNAGERNHNLDQLSRRYLNHATQPISELIGTGKNQKSMADVPINDVGWYAAEDADVPFRLRPILEKELQQAELQKLFVDVEMPLVEVLAELEWTGIRVDVARLAELSSRYTDRMEVLEGQIYESAGREFNIASPKQLAVVLFNELGLPVVKKTKNGPSTDSEVLEQLAVDHDLPAKIIEFRQFAKLKNTYVDALPAMIHPETGRVHASFNQVVAATGRLSSSDPNLQNIPVRTIEGREIRSAFLPEEGWKLLAADYSQIELRVLADFSGDEALLAAFGKDEDIHARVAGEVYGVALEQVTPEMRRVAKAVNFGVIYGQSPFGLAKALKIEKDEAARFIDAYFQQYPGVDKFLTKTLENCRENGYVKTVLGRRRAIRGIRAGAGRQKNLPERTAINTLIQGSAADLIKLAMINIHRRLQREKFAARMLLQIHDELIFEVPSDQLSDLGNLVAEEMAGAVALAVPLKVDLKSGDNWADCEPW